MSKVAHFFVVFGGSKIHGRMAQFFIDIYNGLKAEPDEELCYSKYYYKNKDTENSRNAHRSKHLRTTFGDAEVSVPRDRKGEFEPQVLKKNQTSISQDIEEKILSMYAKGMTTSDIKAQP